MPKILVVDDEPDICDFLQKFLTKRGFEVFTATSGKEAIEKTKSECPHLILLDMVMPGMDGLMVLKEVRAINPKIRIIMVTAVYDEDVARKTLAEGADDYITKPIALDYLETSVMVKITQTLG